MLSLYKCFTAQDYVHNGRVNHVFSANRTYQLFRRQSIKQFDIEIFIFLAMECGLMNGLSEFDDVLDIF